MIVGQAQEPRYDPVVVEAGVVVEVDGHSDSTDVDVLCLGPDDVVVEERYLVVWMPP